MIYNFKKFNDVLTAKNIFMISYFIFPINLSISGIEESKRSSKTQDISFIYISKKRYLSEHGYFSFPR